jgi:hypothetical protein
MNIGLAESAWEDKATWLGDHDLSAQQTVEPSSVQDNCDPSPSGRGTQTQQARTSASVLLPPQKPSTIMPLMPSNSVQLDTNARKSSLLQVIRI